MMMKGDARTAAWAWPMDDQQRIDLSLYDVRRYTKAGMSDDMCAARARVCDAAPQRRAPPIHYLVKFGDQAIHERVYYLLARALDVPHQHVYWATYPAHPGLLAAALRYEATAIRPRTPVSRSDGSYRWCGAVKQVINSADLVRHDALRAIVVDMDVGAQLMVRDGVAFGIDAAVMDWRERTEAEWRALCAASAAQGVAYHATFMATLRRFAQLDGFAAQVHADMADQVVTTLWHHTRWTRARVPVEDQITDAELVAVHAQFVDMWLNTPLAGVAAQQRVLQTIGL